MQCFLVKFLSINKLLIIQSAVLDRLSPCFASKSELSCWKIVGLESNNVLCLTSLLSNKTGSRMFTPVLCVSLVPMLFGDAFSSKELAVCLCWSFLSVVVYFCTCPFRKKGQLKETTSVDNRQYSEFLGLKGKIILGSLTLRASEPLGQLE